jgi:hypothetical protein
MSQKAVVFVQERHIRRYCAEVKNSRRAVTRHCPRGREAGTRLAVSTQGWQPPRLLNYSYAKVLQGFHFSLQEA